MKARARTSNPQPELFREEHLEDVLTPSQKPVARPNRVVTLAFLSQHLPERIISENLARSLYSATEAPVLLVRVDAPQSSVLLRDFVAGLPSLNGEFCFADRLRQCATGVQLLDFRMTAESNEPGVIKSLFDHFAVHFEHVILLVNAETSELTLHECFSRSDLTCLFVRYAAQDSRDHDRLLHELRDRSEGDCGRFKTVFCLAEGERTGLSPGPAQYADGPANTFLHGCPMSVPRMDCSDTTVLPGVFVTDLRRLAREIGRCRLGLALSSGGARGLAHIGVLQVLEENGIEVDVMTGCSMGAYVAAAWGAGCDGGTMERLAREVEGRWGVWHLVDPVFPPRQGFMRGLAVKRRLQRTIGGAHFSELPRPVYIVATNLYTLDRTVFASGEVASAVHASIAIPGVCAPVIINGEAYVDGGVVDPLPLDVLEELGVDRIIAVNTIPTPAYLRCCLEMEREQEELYGRRRILLKTLNRRLNYFAPGNILDIMMRAVHGAQIRVAEEACRHADVVLRPLGMDARWYEFDKPRKYIALGRRVAEEHLDEIRALANRKVSSHEHEPAHHEMAGLA